MTELNRMRWAGLAVLAVLVSLSGELRWAWQHAPFDRLGWLLALVWAGWVIRLGTMQPGVAAPHAGWLIAAVAAGLISFIGQLNVAGHVGLALAMAAWMHNCTMRTLAAVAAIAWFPALGWIAAKAVSAEGGILAVRCLVLAGAIGLGWRLQIRKGAHA
jgi:hypothetical protein